MRLIAATIANDERTMGEGGNFLRISSIAQLIPFSPPLRGGVGTFPYDMHFLRRGAQGVPRAPGNSLLKRMELLCALWLAGNVSELKTLFERERA